MRPNIVNFLALTLTLLLASLLAAANQAPPPPQAPPIPESFNEYGLTPREVADFCAVSCDIRSGRYRDEDSMWASLQRRTGSGDGAVKLRNQLAFLSNRRQLPTLAKWADAIDQVASPAGRAPQAPPTKVTKSRRADGGCCSPACTCGCNEGGPCLCGAPSDRLTQPVTAEPYFYELPRERYAGYGQPYFPMSSPNRLQFRGARGARGGNCSSGG